MSSQRLKDLREQIEEKDPSRIANFTRESLRWFSRFVRTRVKVFKTKTELIKDQDREKVRRINYGEMYVFQYDPKTKEKLPYYDIFPLVIPLERSPGGFIGINFHYLPPRERALLFFKLIRDFKIEDQDGNQYIYLRYRFLKRSSKYRLYKPCIKRYFYGNIKGQMVKIPEKDWNIVVFLPAQQFVGEKEDKIWQESLEKAE